MKQECNGIEALADTENNLVLVQAANAPNDGVLLGLDDRLRLYHEEHLRGERLLLSLLLTSQVDQKNW